MRAMRDRINIEKIVDQQQADGHLRKVPSRLLTNVPCDHDTITGTEIAKRGLKIEATELAVFECRELPSTVDTTSQVVFGGVTYGIVSIRAKPEKVGNVKKSLIYAKAST